VPTLLVRSGQGAILWAHRLSDPVEVRLEYQHSVERTPVLEVYVAGPGVLRFTRMEFVSQGAGLPTSGYVREGGRFVLREVRVLPALAIRVSRLTGPRLVVDGRELDLLALAGDGGTVEVSSGRRSRAASIADRFTSQRR
jgi:hypothetical protein